MISLISDPIPPVMEEEVVEGWIYWVTLWVVPHQIQCLSLQPMPRVAVWRIYWALAHLLPPHRHNQSCQCLGQAVLLGNHNPLRHIKIMESRPPSTSSPTRLQECVECWRCSITAIPTMSIILHS